MNRILQIDPTMPFIIHRWGCNFRALLAILEEEEEREFKSWEILKIWMDCFHSGEVTDKSKTLDPDGILRRGIKHWGLSDDYSIYQIGADGVFWRWVRDKRIDHTIIKGLTRNGNDHFRLGDRDAHLIWDPDPDVEVVSEQSIIYYHRSEV